jgi:hypothetical protein
VQEKKGEHAFDSSVHGEEGEPAASWLRRKKLRMCCLLPPPVTVTTRLIADEISPPGKKSRNEVLHLGGMKKGEGEGGGVARKG